MYTGRRIYAAARKGSSRCSVAVYSAGAGPRAARARARRELVLRTGNCGPEEDERENIGVLHERARTRERAPGLVRCGSRWLRTSSRRGGRRGPRSGKRERERGREILHPPDYMRLSSLVRNFASHADT